MPYHPTSVVLVGLRVPTPHLVAHVSAPTSTWPGSRSLLAQALDPEQRTGNPGFARGGIVTSDHSLIHVNPCVCVCMRTCVRVMCLLPGAIRDRTHAEIMVGRIHHISILMAWQASVRSESSASNRTTCLYISKDQNMP